VRGDRPVAAASPRPAPGPPAPQEASEPGPAPTASAERPPDVDLEQIQSAWKQSVLAAVGERSIPTASILAEGRPVELANDTLVIEFPPDASFHRDRAQDPKNATVLAEVLYEVTGRRLAADFVVGDADAEPEQAEDDGPVSEEEIISLMKTTFDAREVEDS
jgi:hypothetical protein